MQNAFENRYLFVQMTNALLCWNSFESEKKHNWIYCVVSGFFSLQIFEISNRINTYNWFVCGGNHTITWWLFYAYIPLNKPHHSFHPTNKNILQPSGNDATHFLSMLIYFICSLSFSNTLFVMAKILTHPSHQIIFVLKTVSFVGNLFLAHCV